jgi:DNA replication protein DnaC
VGPSCNKCGDTDWEPVAGLGVRRCVCVAEREQAKRLASVRDRLNVIPPEFRWVDLHTLQPDPARHPRQGEVIEQILREPFRSRGLFGRSGIGKTLLSWGIVRLAIEDGRIVYGIKLQRLLEQLRAAEFDFAQRPVITAEELIQMEEGATVFLDDISRPTPSSYAGGKFYDILDAIYESRRHQLVVTCHCPLKALESHWNKAGEELGTAIVRRIVETHGAQIPKLF